MLFNDAVFAIHKTDKHQRDVIARSTKETLENAGHPSENRGINQGQD